MKIRLEVFAAVLIVIGVNAACAPLAENIYVVAELTPSIDGARQSKGENDGARVTKGENDGARVTKSENAGTELPLNLVVSPVAEIQRAIRDPKTGVLMINELTPEQISKVKSDYRAVTRVINSNLTDEQFDIEFLNAIKKNGKTTPHFGAFAYGLTLFDDAMRHSQFHVAYALKSPLGRFHSSIDTLITSELRFMERIDPTIDPSVANLRRFDRIVSQHGIFASIENRFANESLRMRLSLGFGTYRPGSINAARRLSDFSFRRTYFNSDYGLSAAGNNRSLYSYDNSIKKVNQSHRNNFERNNFERDRDLSYDWVGRGNTQPGFDATERTFAVTETRRGPASFGRAVIATLTFIGATAKYGRRARRAKEATDVVVDKLNDEVLDQNIRDQELATRNAEANVAEQRSNVKDAEDDLNRQKSLRQDYEAAAQTTDDPESKARYEQRAKEAAEKEKEAAEELAKQKALLEQLEKALREQEKKEEKAKEAKEKKDKDDTAGITVRPELLYELQERGLPPELFFERCLAELEQVINPGRPDHYMIPAIKIGGVNTITYGDQFTEELVTPKDFLDAIARFRVNRDRRYDPVNLRPDITTPGNRDNYPITGNDKN